MKTIRAYKYRLYPTRNQEEIIDTTLDMCRNLYNAGLQERIEAYKKCDISLNYSDKTWICPQCGKSVNRDINASRNIEYEGMRQTDSYSTVRNTGFKACGEIGQEDYSLKQEYVRQSFALSNT